MQTREFWLNVALIAAGVVLPFGTLILIGVAAARTQVLKPRPATIAQEEMWQWHQASRGRTVRDDSYRLIDQLI
jgi:hypothetical protein